MQLGPVSGAATIRCWELHVRFDLPDLETAPVQELPGGAHTSLGIWNSFPGLGHPPVQQPPGPLSLLLEACQACAVSRLLVILLESLLTLYFLFQHI